MTSHTIAVSNAGRHPELAELAAGLAEADVPISYWTSLSWAEDDAAMVAGRLLPKSRGRQLLLNRQLPQPLRRIHVQRRAKSLEALFQACLPVSHTWSDRILGLRTKTFDRAVARSLRRIEPRAVVAQFTNAFVTFQSLSPSTVKILNYPIAHHHWITERMRQEKAENSPWARFLQHAEPDVAHQRRLDAEIAMADHVLVPSSFVADTFVAWGVPTDKLHVLPLGAQASWFPSAEITVGHGSDTDDVFRVLFAGQLTQRKGISYLLEGFRRADLPNSRLILAGRPYAGIESMLKNYSFVDLRGSLTRQELGQFYREADVLVLPSLAEGFPLVAIEAMTLGTTVIVSENTFAHDVIEDGENGFVVSATDVDGLAERLRTLQADPKRRRRMGQAAAATAQQFTWSSYRQNSARTVISLLTDQSTR